MLITYSANAFEITQTNSFRTFVRAFFLYPDYQLSHVKFPLLNIEREEHDPESPSITRYINKTEWKHLPGPAYYKCETDCYDIVIYDSFEKKHKESNERVLAFEGVENGIYISLYFKYIEGVWYLVKYEDYST